MFSTSQVYGSLFIILLLSIGPLYGQYPELGVGLISGDLKDKAIAVVRYDRNELDFSNASKTRIKKEYAITVLNKSGKKHLSFYKGYKEGSDKVKSIKIELIDPFGQVLESYTNKDIEDRASYDGFSVFTDFRVKYLALEAARYPITMKYSYVIERKNTFPPNWYPVPSYGVSVEHSSYRIVSSQLDDFSIQSKNMEDEKWKISEQHFELRDFKAKQRERYSPGFRDIFPIVYVRPSSFTFEGFEGNYSNWQEFGNWRHQNFLMGRDNLSRTILSDIQPYVKDSSDPYEIAKGVYEFIQETTRYVSISLDEGAIQPMFSSEVHSKKYGDCKALSFYMKSILELYNIKSNYVEIHAESDELVSYLPDFASSTQGNHIILAIPFEEDTVWVDCTSKRLPFNFLGDFTDDRLCLSIDHKGHGEIVRTPRYDFNRNQICDSIHIKLEKDLTRLNVERNFVGIPMANFSGILDLESEEKMEYALKSMHKDFTQTRVEGPISCSKSEKNDLLLNMDYSIHANNMRIHAGKYVMLPLNVLPFEIPNLGKKKDRKRSIVFPRSKAYKSFIEIEIPDHLRFADFKGEKHMISDFADYSLSLLIQENKVIVEREFRLKKGTFSKDLYPEIQEFFKTVKQNETLPCIFETAAP
ncbi:MAG: DUF3857 domain-containing protein [Bacteroidota bacterium]